MKKDTMGIEIITVGGYFEIGRNMTAVRIDDEIVILDMGLHLPNWIRLTEEEGENITLVGTETLRKAGAVPNDNVIQKLKKHVKAIIPTHAHLDHIGAIPYLAKKYDAPVIATPYTCAVLQAILKDEKIKLRNKIIPVNLNATYQVSKNIKAEFINMTHSTPHTAMVALHTKYGIILYALDFKLDNTPTLGQKPNYAALKRISKKGVKVVIMDSLYGKENRKCPSESVAREMLREVMLGVNSKGKCVIVTTFSSHMARMKSIVEFGRKMDRKIIMMGRSLKKYVSAAKAANVIDLLKHVQLAGRARQIRQVLADVERRGRHKYLLIVTGHQGEPKATLSKMANGILPWKFRSDDHVIFSSAIIPTKINQDHRKRLEKILKTYGVRIFSDIHVSGHAAREDHRDFLHLVKAEHVIPAHAEEESEYATVDLCVELGYKRGKTVHVLRNGDKLRLA